MSFISKILDSAKIKDAMFKQLASAAKEQGFSHVFIEIKENGQFEMETIKEGEKILVKKETYNFLLNFYNQNKPSL